MLAYLNGLPVVLDVAVRADVAVGRVLNAPGRLVEVVALAGAHDVAVDFALDPDGRDHVAAVARQLGAAVRGFASHVYPRHLHRPISLLRKRISFPSPDMRACSRRESKGSPGNLVVIPHVVTGKQ